MEFAGYIAWGFISYMASLALFVFVVIVRCFYWPLFFGYVAAVILFFTTLTAFDGFCVAWSTGRNSSRAANHIFAADDSAEQIRRFRYPTAALATLLALALLHFAPRRQRNHEPPPLPRLNAAAERQYAKDAKILEPPSLQRLSSSSRRLLNEAELQARGLDDNHVGTEHIVLAIFRLGHRVATHTLETLGVTRELFTEQLHEEPGPSPSGKIPLTPRARMIVALAGAEASRMGSEPVEPEHILLGVIRESQRWEATGMSGPHHLRAAAEAAGITLSALEQKLIQEMGRDDEPAA